MEKKDNKKTLIIKIGQLQHSQFKSITNLKGVSMQEVIENFICDYIDENKAILAELSK